MSQTLKFVFTTNYVNPTPDFISVLLMRLSLSVCIAVNWSSAAAAAAATSSVYIW